LEAFLRNIALVFIACLISVVSFGQDKLSPKWEELTAPDFVAAIKKAQNTCVLPFGILEKHGPHLPIGTDLINVRFSSLRAVEQEYAVVFPEYYVGQIFEARHQPGTVAYSLQLQLQLLQETTDEMARNGCKKILIVNGHGGNNSLLPLYGQAQLALAKDYVVYVYMLGGYDVPGRPAMKTTNDLHGGESETSRMMVSRPDLLHIDRAASQSGEDQDRIKGLPAQVYTGIWWYAKFPNHYSGEGAAARKELGEFDMNTWSTGIAGALKAIKADENSLKLQQEFYERAKKPLETKQ
jgi:creatinine amidohydrolase